MIQTDVFSVCVSYQKSTWFNKGEIEATVDIVKSLMRDAASCAPPLRPSEISIMAPWREQVWKLRERLREENLNAVDVGSVEVYCHCSFFFIFFLGVFQLKTTYAGFARTRESRSDYIVCSV